MSIEDLSLIFTWWVIFLLIGIVSLPFTAIVFSRFLDRGYIFAKILGVLMVSYAIFVAATVKILPFTHMAIVLTLLIWGMASVFILVKVEPSRRFNHLKSWKLFLFEEFLFLGALSFWSYIRAHEPSIHGLEKYMDFGFVNSILRAEYFPAKDLWLTPLSINYYYFGHLVTAVLTKLSGIDPAIAYNLMIATLFAFTFTCAFSIGLNLINQFKTQNAKLKITGQNLKVIIIGGLLTGFLVALAGNLHTIYAFFAAYDGESPVPFWQLAMDFDFSKYWYPNATRFIPFTIHEFPLYSFVVSDLHGHVLSIPIVLTIIAILLHEISRIGKRMTVNISTLVLLAFLIAASYMTNAWDGIIYTGLIGFVFFFAANISKNYFQYAIRLALVIVGAAIFSLPFSLHFKPFVSGIGIVKDHSPLYMILILWGFFYFFVMSFLAFLRKKEQTIIDTFVLVLIFISTLLIVFPEFFYAKDIYPAHYRANTMFKLGYQAFMMLGISTAYMILRLITNYKLLITNLKLYQKLLLVVLVCIGGIGLFLVGIYPYFAINSYYGSLKVNRGLDGLAYLRDLYPEDYEAILWTRDNIKGQPVILEGAGESYTDYARVSANTGLPTVIGWPVHEWLWRGSYDEAGKRVTEVEQAYTIADIEQTKAFLEKYKVEYIFVGILERQKYPNLNEEKFKTLGEAIYQNGQSTVYKIR